jgi:hypothetical protein
MKTLAPGAYPEAVTLKGRGAPDALPGTANGEVEGEVTVAALATPAPIAMAPATRSPTRRKREKAVLIPKQPFEDRMRPTDSCTPGRRHPSARVDFQVRLLAIHPGVSCRQPTAIAVGKIEITPLAEVARGS